VHSQQTHQDAASQPQEVFGPLTCRASLAKQAGRTTLDAGPSTTGTKLTVDSERRTTMTTAALIPILPTRILISTHLTVIPMHIPTQTPTGTSSIPLHLHRPAHPTTTIHHPTRTRAITKKRIDSTGKCFTHRDIGDSPRVSVGSV
jgi:hypothetical protein